MLPEITFTHVFFIGIALVLMLLFSPTRAVLGWAFKLSGSGLKALAGMLFAFIHSTGSKLIDAHLCWLHNWKPRQMVMPSQRNKRSTNRQ